MTGKTIMDEALRIRHKRGTLRAISHLTGKGFPYELAVMALIGLRNSNLAFGAGFKNVSSLKRGRQVGNVIELTR